LTGNMRSAKSGFEALADVGIIILELRHGFIALKGA
jgi:hypothetical protein